MPISVRSVSALTSLADTCAKSYRTGTLSLYHALRILGYKTYHGAEVMAHGTSHLEIFEEALKAKHFGIGKPYGKAEFDKWFAEYDVCSVPHLLLLFLLQSVTWLAFPYRCYLSFT